jgi:thioredoxin 1
VCEKLLKQMVKSITAEDFKDEISQGLVIVDFWAEWCGPCRQMMPILEKISEKYGSAVKILKLNVDESSNLATAYGIRSIPTFVAFKDGERIEVKTGGMSFSGFEQWVDVLLKK